MSWGGWGTVVWESLDDCLEVLDNDISFFFQHNPQALKGLLSYLCASAPAIPWQPCPGLLWEGSHIPLSLWDAMVRIGSIPETDEFLPGLNLLPHGRAVSEHAFCTH